MYFFTLKVNLSLIDATMLGAVPISSKLGIILRPYSGRLLSSRKYFLACHIKLAMPLVLPLL